MQFFKVEGLIADENWAEKCDDRRSLREKVRKIAMQSNAFNQKQKKKAFFYVTDVSEDTATVGVICRESISLDKQIESYLAAIEINLKDIYIEEITFSATRNMLQCASRNDYIGDDDEVLELFGLDKLTGRYGRSVEYGENIFDESDKGEIYKEADRFLARDTFIPELDRIFSGKSAYNACGHPVHYIVQTDDRETRKSMYRLLLQALYSNGRLRSKRYSYLDFKPGDNFSSAVYDCLYKSSIGGAVIVRYLANDDTEDEYATCGRDTIETLCEIMKRYRNQVLTVFCLPRECTKSKDMFYENLGNTSFIELKEEFVSGERAERFLKMLAKDNGVRPDKKLFAMLENDKGYLAPDLHEIFEEWFNNKLKTCIFPQYKDITTAKCEVVKAAPKGSAYDELMEMIGIDDAKKVIIKALNYYKAQKLFADKGMKTDRPAMHMVFTGNPGTAKTTVARLFARIMKENDLLSKGNLIEVGRGDLVGKFVGWTAPTIQKKFRDAQGSVLFIDEAYSLVDDRNGSFGDEAINTIVQEMENHRDDVVVIFAGYPDKMEGFLRKNPGLRSRIAFHVPFADYGTDELCKIANLIAKKKGLKLAEDVDEKLTVIFNDAKSEADFGNGRYVRNIIEKAKMAQATRLLNMDFDLVGKDDIVTICAEDIEAPPVKSKKARNPIGFSVA